MLEANRCLRSSGSQLSQLPACRSEGGLVKTMGKTARAFRSGRASRAFAVDGRQRAHEILHLHATEANSITRRMSLMSVGQVWDNGRAVLSAAWCLRNATSVGRRARVWGHPKVVNRGRLLIGDRARLVSTIATLEISVGTDGILEIGNNVFINYGCSIAATQRVHIGSDCAIGTYCIMMDNDFHRLEPERRFELPESAPIVLQDNVWLGARVIVLRGVTIGAGSAIGAGSVVTHDIPARSLAAGIPARVIRSI